MHYKPRSQLPGARMNLIFACARGAGIHGGVLNGHTGFMEEVGGIVVGHVFHR